MIGPADVAGVVLAGGRSSRMSRPDKPLRALAGKPMIAHAVERLRPQVSALAVNANGDPGRFAELRLPILADAIGGYAGPLAGILAGLEWATGVRGTTHLASAAGDTPFFPADLVLRLAGACATGECVAIASTAGRQHPVFGLWPLTLREPLRTFLDRGGRRVMSFVEGLDCTTVDYPLRKAAGKAFDPFFNVNTEDDLAEAQRLAVELEG